MSPRSVPSLLPDVEGEDPWSVLVSTTTNPHSVGPYLPYVRPGFVVPRSLGY